MSDPSRRKPVVVFGRIPIKPSPPKGAGSPYYLSFRIAKQERMGWSYEQRRGAIEDIASDGRDTRGNPRRHVWKETTSFLIFNDTRSAAEIARACKAVIDPSVDHVLIRALNIPDARVVGVVTDQDLFSYFTLNGQGYLKKV